MQKFIISDRVKESGNTQKMTIIDSYRNKDSNGLDVGTVIYICEWRDDSGKLQRKDIPEDDLQPFE